MRCVQKGNQGQKPGKTFTCADLTPARPFLLLGRLCLTVCTGLPVTRRCTSCAEIGSATGALAVKHNVEALAVLPFVLELHVADANCTGCPLYQRIPRWRLNEAFSRLCLMTQLAILRVGLCLQIALAYKLHRHVDADSLAKCAVRGNFSCRRGSSHALQLTQLVLLHRSGKHAILLLLLLCNPRLQCALKLRIDR